MVVRSRLLITLLPVLALTLGGCDVLKKKKEPEKKKEPTSGVVLIGMIEMVNPEQRYVLIRCEQLIGLPAGTPLIAVDRTGAQSKLVLTPERKGFYLTADIKEGSPQVTNLVMQQRGGGGSLATAPAAGTSPGVGASTGAAPVPVAPTRLPGPPLDNPLSLPTATPTPASTPTLLLEPPLPQAPRP